jgi:hypothetical protein
MTIPGRCSTLHSLCARTSWRRSFLWVDFANEEIEKRNFGNIETVLNTLPPTMIVMYTYILLKISPTLTNLVAGLLR